MFWTKLNSKPSIKLGTQKLVYTRGGLDVKVIYPGADGCVYRLDKGVWFVLQTMADENI